MIMGDLVARAWQSPSRFPWRADTSAPGKGCLLRTGKDEWVSDRTGSGLVELAILETLSAATGGRPQAHVVSTKAVAGIEERIGLGPRYGYEVLLDLARPWIVPMPTVSVAGNKGDRDFPEAAGPEYTECRPSHT